MGKTYLCGKIGKSVKFNPNTWSAIGGDNEGPKLIKAIATLNPYDTFIIISKSDLQKARLKGIELPPNLHDVYEGASKKERCDNSYLIERLKDVKIDGCFLMSGPSGTTNIPETLYKRKELKEGKKEFAKSLETFQNYVAPMYKFLNYSNIPWVMIANDPRYIQQGNDCLNHPVRILSQFNETIEMKGVNNFEEQKRIKNMIPAAYNEMEKMFLIGTEHPKVHLDSPRPTKFMIVLNQGNNGVQSRYEPLKKFVLAFIDDVHVYGKWDDSIIEKDKRFKGSKKFVDLQEDLPFVKYTFIIPIKPGWVTSKWVEMISNGIIPFFHPDYDTQKHCPVPDFIRIKEPAELHKKIEMLEENPDMYREILRQCISCITDEDLTGQRLNDIVLYHTPEVQKDGVEFQSEVVPKVDPFDDW